ncbi:MAG: hypothetical protein KDJ38_09760 [Gammaproteobacteria bacterium]|nr:hypothetical protein [Gammaproteobacteria bacterium]
MKIRSQSPMSTRPCQYCLAMRDDSVFADFGVDERGCLYILRISYDGYGCCHPEHEKKPGVMNKEASKQLIALVESNELAKPEASSILREYFQENQEMLWPEALKVHGLI